MTKLFNREGAERLKKRVVEGEPERGQRLAGGLLYQINALHSLDYFPDEEIEELLLKQKEHDLKLLKEPIQLPDGLIRFSPSGASKCRRDLYFKSIKEEKDEILRYPYQRRWTRNASAVHEAIQRDLLYCEKHLTDGLMFTVKRLDNGLPAWEENIKKAKIIEYKGTKFVLYGMCDGLLEYKADGSTIGFEFKTKSTTLGAVGTFKLKEPAADHKAQATAYALLFGVDEFIFVYESLAKDGWLKGADAKPDIRTFYHKVTDADKVALLERLKETADAYYSQQLPEKELEKCMFCQYKTVCQTAGGGTVE